MRGLVARLYVLDNEINKRNGDKRILYEEARALHINVKAIKDLVKKRHIGKLPDDDEKLIEAYHTSIIAQKEFRETR